MRNLLAVAGLTLVCASAAGSAQTAPFRLVPLRESGAVKYKLDDAVAEGVAVDTDGNIYVGETIAGTPSLAGRAAIL